MRIFHLFLLTIFMTSCGAKESTTNDTNAASAIPVVSSNGAISSVASGTAPVGPAKINITAEGMPDGPVFLIGFYETDQYRVDSSAVKNQKVTFQKKEGYDQGFYFVYFPDRSSLQLLLGEDQEFNIKTKAGDITGSTQIEGCIDNELLYDDLRFQTDLNNQLQAINSQIQAAGEGTDQANTLAEQRNQVIASRDEHLAELFAKAPNSFFTSFKSSGQNPNIQVIKETYPSLDEAGQVDVYRQQFWDNVNFNDERLLRTPVIINKLKRYMTEITAQTPDAIIKSTDQLVSQVDGKHPEFFKFFVNWIAIQYQPTKTTLMDSEAVMVHMVQNYFTNEKAFWAEPAEIQGLQQRASEMQASLVGKKGPDVISTGPDGKTRSIYEMKEPYIVVYMFNPECEHCQEETPILKEYHDKNKKKVGVFAIAIDTDETKWKNYIQKVGMQDFVNVFDSTNRSIYAKYFVDKTPEMYVLNKDRVIIGKNLRTFQLDELINREEAKN